MSTARAPGAVADGVAVERDSFAVEHEIAGQVAQLIDVRIVDARRLAGREAVRWVDAAVIELDADLASRSAYDDVVVRELAEHLHAANPPSGKVMSLRSTDCVSSRVARAPSGVAPNGTSDAIR